MKITGSAPRRRGGAGPRLVAAVAGLSLGLVLLEVGLRILGAGYIWLQGRRGDQAVRLTQVPLQSVRGQGALRVLCVGESTTALGGRYSYPSQLQEVLNQRGGGQKFVVINRGFPMANTSEILMELEQNLDRYKPQLVVAMMGANDRGVLLPLLNKAGGERSGLYWLKTVRLALLLHQEVVKVLRDEGPGAGDGPASILSAGAPPEIDLSARRWLERDRVMVRLFLSHVRGLNAPGQEPLRDPIYSHDPRYVPGLQNLLDLTRDDRYKAFVKKGSSIHVEHFDALEESYNRQGKVKLFWQRLQGPLGRHATSVQFYLDLSRLLWGRGKLELNDLLLNKALADGLADERTRLYLGFCLEKQGRHRQAQRMYQQALRLRPRWLVGLLLLGHNHARLGEHQEAFAAFYRALAVNPQNLLARLEYGAYLSQRGRAREALAAFEEALHIDPAEAHALFGLGASHESLKQYAEAEEALATALKLRPNCRSHQKLTAFYTRRKDRRKLNLLLDRARKLPRKSRCLVDLIGRYYAGQGKRRASVQSYEEASYYAPLTRRSYRALLQSLLQRQIRLVAVQYPGRSVEPLRRLFEPGLGVLFVDNEASFQRAVAREGYSELFVDDCYGDFGHGTARGNRLLARNVAAVILAELTGKK